MTTNGLGNAWVGNELQVMQRAGIPCAIHSMRPTDHTYFTSEWAQELDDGTHVLYPVSPIVLIISVVIGPFVFGGAFFSALWNALFGKREHRRARCAGLWHFAVACGWARQIRRKEISHIHSQWIHSGGTVAMYGAWLLGKSFSFTGHATDLFRDRCALADKIRRAQFIVCISEFHRAFFLREGARPEQLIIAYCGIDTGLFSVQGDVPRKPGPVRIRSSGRLVEKKGFVDLIRACSFIKSSGLEFECVIAGSGPQKAELETLIAKLDLHGEVSLTGEPLKQEDIPSFMHGGDLYCLPCIWAEDNDVDGLPQMLMEAMACGLPVVSTRLVGIPDLVVHEQTGLLVDPNDPDQLHSAMIRLITDTKLATALAVAGRAKVCADFDLSTCLGPLIERYRLALESNSRSAAQTSVDPAA